ncbi:alkaline phosphatase, tissue-nonspecific isozyme-like isoform X1 [Mytilus californianus]|uniref:alkaline phosphatase, tissue-nonspecific isozyme-like isoform X1 n=2 Tax=Mytilus californianus TaxID=6549 RepID=UPI0022484BD9|nr:alkaline phosphatase, tissue-nonspecific isozyme-like isoform X1 [Mytilus californianus]
MTPCDKHVVLFSTLFILFWNYIYAQEAYVWRKESQEILKNALNRKLNTNVAKNVILFIGDGMGVSTVTAARILRGQKQGRPGEETVLEFEKFPHVALAKTYNIDKQTPDSGATATALMTGIKANYYTIGVDGRAKYANCSSIKNAKVDGMVNWSKFAGKSTGIVTSTRVTHATPAAAYAHAPQREWESDIKLPADHGECKDIAYQLIVDQSDMQVILGGGRQYFMTNTSVDPETKKVNSAKGRRDGLDLIQMWKLDKEERGATYKYVWNNSDFNAIDPAKTDYLLGLFQLDHLDYELERDHSDKGEPSLPELVRKAIQILSKNDNGFFLMVEGGRIDHGHHDGKAKKALYETLSLEDAVREAVALTDEKETLIVVTADHSHVFNIAGYPKRGNDILGVVDPLFRQWYPLDGKAYTTLLYANGPGFNTSGSGRTDPLDEVEDLHDKDYVRNSGVPLKSETHGGEDVAIYAQGPMAHLIYGVQEQHYVAHVMAYASCVGQNKDHCRQTNTASSLQNSFINSCFILLLNSLFYSTFL